MLIVTPFLTPAGWLEMEYDEHFIYRAVFIEPPIEKPSEAPGQLGALITA